MHSQKSNIKCKFGSHLICLPLNPFLRICTGVLPYLFHLNFSLSTPGNGNVARTTERLYALVAGLVRAIMAELLGMSAGALGGIHLVLAGPSAAAAVASSSQVSCSRTLLIPHDLRS